MRKALIVIVVALCIIGIAQYGYAQDAGRKLLRGIGNVATGWLEIPNQIYKESVASNVLVGLTWGTVKGAGWTVVRTVTGAYEIVTFPFPIPSGYEPIVQPEYVFSK
ncbi:MAG: exosortase system-associated protein, TIGR04073 family [Candidatus Omnitrophota bacterium]